MKQLVLAFLILFPGIVFTQWLSSPYSAELVPISSNQNLGIIHNYLMDFDIDNDGELEIIVLDSITVRFYEKDFSIIDAINVEQRSDHFSSAIGTLAINGINYIILSVSSHFKGELWLVNIRKDRSVFKKVLYSFYSGSSIPDFFSNIFQPNDSLALINISINYPLKHDYKKIIALNTKDFSIKWIKYTADYIYDFFVNDKKPGYFYYTTYAWFNRVYFSNNTYYDTKAQTNEIYIDTAFTNKVYPLPDENAKDYSCDSASYLVKADLNGNIIYRKRTGSRFQHLTLIDNSKDDYALLLLYDQSKLNSKLFKLYKDSDKLVILKKGNLELTNFEPLVNYREGSYFSSTAGKLQFFNIEGDSIIITREHTFNDNLLGKFYGNYFIGQASNGIFKIYDDKLNYLAIIPPVKRGLGYRWSNVMNAILVITDRVSYKLKLTKLSLLQRITPKTLLYLNYLAFAIIVILLSFWIITMRISRQKILMQNEQLIRQQKELELATTNLIRSEKLAILGTVAAGFAHQLNSPIGAILNSAQRLRKEYENENLDLILRSVNFCKSIVNKFLIASRPNEEDNSSCSNFINIWNDWFELYKGDFLSKKIEIITQFDETNKEVKIKNSELIEILNNVLFNARDSVLEAHKEEKFIRITTKVEENKFNLIIEDSGTGFDEKIIDSIFEPFVTTKPKGSGTGLGMWITKKIIDDHNGKIEISNGSEGAIIKIELPIC